MVTGDRFQSTEGALLCVFCCFFFSKRPQCFFYSFLYRLVIQLYEYQTLKIIDHGNFKFAITKLNIIQCK